MKGGSIASRYVLKQLPDKCNTILKPYKFAIGKSNIKAKLYHIGSGKRGSKKRGSKKRGSKKRGGSPMSKIVTNIARLRSLSNKQNPGVFPNIKNCNVNVLDIPKLVGGKRRRKYNKRGGKQVSSVHVKSPTKKKGFKYSHLGKQYHQNKNTITSGRMFYPLTLKQKITSIIKKNKIGPFKISSKTRKFINKIQDYPMFQLLNL